MGLFTKDIKTMNDLFVHQLQDIYYAENQLVKALPKMAEKATDKPAVLNVAVDASGKYAINGLSTPFGSTQNFASALKEAAKGAKEPVIAISADAQATHQAVINVMESARIAGYTHISFTTQARR